MAASTSLRFFPKLMRNSSEHPETAVRRPASRRRDGADVPARVALPAGLHVAHGWADEVANVPQDRIPLPPPDIEIALRGLSLFTPLNPARGARLPCVTATCPHGAGDHIRVA
jgi:hypothetical protein